MSNMSDQGSRDYNENLENDPILLRLIYVILFYVILSLCRFVVAVVAGVQFLHVLFTEELQSDLLRFSQSLTRYIGQLAGYITWAENTKPFPFTDWPSQRDASNE